MAIPALKCPFLSQLTLQQVRASAPHILNAGIESCPIFSQFARKISTSNVHDTGNLSSSMSRLHLVWMKSRLFMKKCLDKETNNIYHQRAKQPYQLVKHHCIRKNQVHMVKVR